MELSVFTCEITNMINSAIPEIAMKEYMRPADMQQIIQCWRNRLIVVKNQMFQSFLAKTITPEIFNEFLNNMKNKLEK